jgi:hypothetical protein
VEKVEEISCLTADDYIKIVSTFTAAFDMQFNCGKCNKRYPKLPDKLKEHKARLGCDGKRDPKLVYLPSYEMDGRPKIVYKRCIGNFFSFKVMDLIRYSGKYSKNIFPYKGSYYDQPNKFVESMELVQNLIMQKESEKKNRLEKRRK